MSATLRIDKGVAIPEARPCGESSWMKFPFKQMKPGDSFLIKDDNGDKRRLDRERAYALLAARQFNVKATSRTVPGGIRVWRVA